MSTSEMTKRIAETPPRPLRLWPGIICIVILLLSRFALKAVIPGFEGFMWAIKGSLGCAVAIVLWWLFFSRARWLDRIGAIVLIAAALGSAWFFKHESMGPAWMVAYAIPFVLLAFVAAVFAGRNLPDFRRRLLFAAAILLGSLGWTLLRTEGIDGDHKATFAWRWSATTEQLLLTKPISPSAPLVEPTHSEPAAPAAEPKPALPTAAIPEWPGFRGPNRDSVVPGVTTATDWSESPPVEIWRKPIGPGWSSFAVQGGIIYTQEQRGEEELVTAYKAATGDLVWCSFFRIERRGRPARHPYSG